MRQKQVHILSLTHEIELEHMVFGVPCGWQGGGVGGRGGGGDCVFCECTRVPSGIAGVTGFHGVKITCDSVTNSVCCLVRF